MNPNEKLLGFIFFNKIMKNSIFSWIHLDNQIWFIYLSNENNFKQYLVVEQFTSIVVNKAPIVWNYKYKRLVITTSLFLFPARKEIKKYEDL